MKKIIVIVTALVILVLLFFYFRYIYGWYEFKFYKETPKNYVSNIIINKEQYSSDSANIVLQIQGFVKNHQESFYSKEYDESTRIIVDSILYSPDYKKIATFIIAKNPTNKQLMPDKKYKWYYDGFLYIGNKDGDSVKINSTGEGQRNYKEINELSGALKNLFFEKYSSTKDNSGNEKLYNLNDIRYWEKSIDWGNLEYNRKMQKDFEEEKKNHPENVYDPNDRK